MTPWNNGPKSLLDVGKGARVLDELHWDAGLSLRRIIGCLKGWRRSMDLDLGSWYRSTEDLGLGSSYYKGDLNLDWSKLSLTVPSASCWTKSRSGFLTGFWTCRG